jgi:predicted regulator of Ras-like GTPase activity (Roadblock/LC7/MglB family)
MAQTRRIKKVDDPGAFGVSKSRVTEVDAARIKRVFDALVTETGARCAILLETTGALLAKIGDAGTLKLHTVASLLASQLAVAHLVAKHFEGEFTIMLSQGRNRNIQLQMVGKKRVLAVIFGAEASLGNVLMGARRAANRLQVVMPRTSPKLPSVQRAVQEARAETPGLGREFADAAKSKIDELLQ